MAVMFERFKAENALKKYVCSKAAVALSNIRKDLHILRSQICNDTLAMNKNLGNILEQVAKKWKALSNGTIRISENNTALLKSTVVGLGENHRGLSKTARQVFDEVCSKNAVDCQKIVSAVVNASNSSQELEKKAIACTQELERSQLMCQQYKELFEQEQNKVFELLAEREASWHTTCVGSSYSPL
jgi:hypothetical protein